MKNVPLDLSDLTQMELSELTVDFPDRGESLTLEGVAGVGHLMTETGASAVGPNIFICSCCCC